MLREQRLVTVNEVRAALGYPTLDDPDADDADFLSTPYQPRRGEQPIGGIGSNPAQDSE